MNIASIAIFIMIFLLLANLILNKSETKRSISAGDVSAFRIPYSSVTALYDLSQKYGINFSELLAVYSIDNAFFPDKSIFLLTAPELEKKYILNYDQIKTQYPDKLYHDYYKLIHDIFSDASTFPIPMDYDSNSYMYGDSFGSAKYYEENSQYSGTDIIDRENIRGRISVSSITSGTVETIGWNDKDGYHIGIRSPNGVYYLYANLESSAPGYKKGDSIAAGQSIGKMGDTAHSKKEGAAANYPTHVQIKIKPQTAISDDFWFNPYPVLRFIEYKSSEPK